VVTGSLPCAAGNADLRFLRHSDRRALKNAAGFSLLRETTLAAAMSAVRLVAVGEPKPVPKEPCVS